MTTNNSNAKKAADRQAAKKEHPAAEVSDPVDAQDAVDTTPVVADDAQDADVPGGGQGAGYLAQAGAGSPTAGSGDSGVGTHTPAADETGTRPSAGSVVHSAAPIEAPDARVQTLPARGYDASTTNTVAANAAVSTYPGEDHVDLVDEDGRPVSAEDLFESSGGPETFVTVRQRVYEVFAYPGTQRKTRRLLYTQGARVDRLTAERVKSAYRLVRVDDEAQPGRGA